MIYSSFRQILEPVGAAFLLLCLSPFLLAIALMIWISTYENPIFVQERIGYRNKPFKLYKFRSMSPNDTGEPSFASERDPRITKVGKFLRRHRLDELPQLLNVAFGQMALIGPRPEQIYFSQKFEKLLDGYIDRYSVKPGITGLSQVRLGYTSDLQGTFYKLKYDKFYIGNLSLMLDLMILCETACIVLNGRKV